MGINPDAYMSGAIPGLSRGGSWQNVQDPHPSPMGSSMSQAPHGGGSIYPRPSTIVPPSPAQSVHPGMGNRSNSHFARNHHPWAMVTSPALPQSPLSQQQSYAPSYQQSYFGGNGSQGSTGYSASMVSGKAPSVGPTRHPGWQNLNGHYIGGFTSTPSSPSVRTHNHAPPKSATVHSKHPPPGYTSQPASPSRLSTHQQQHEWEWASGSPKPMMAEPDYFSGQSPIQSEKHFRPHIQTPNQGPAPKPMSLRLPSPKRKSKTAMLEPQPLPPPPQSGRMRLDSLRQRPMMQRRHTHDRFSPEDYDSRTVKHDSKSLGRQRRREQRDVGSVAGESYYAPSKSSSMPKSRLTSTAPNSPRGPGSRLAAVPPSSSISQSPYKATSLTERRLKQAGRPALSTIVSTVDFTSSDPSVVHSARPRPNLDMSELGAALPLPPGPVTASPTVYTTSTEVEDYDRYTAHPAAPTPSRKDVAASQGAPPLRMDVKNVKPGDYRPPCFPGPTNNNLKWNRDGPAMKTHGIPWARDSPEGQLPTGPAGPRWAQARPPRLDLQHSGNWWESGVG